MGLYHQQTTQAIDNTDQLSYLKYDVVHFKDVDVMK